MNSNTHGPLRVWMGPPRAPCGPDSADVGSVCWLCSTYPRCERRVDITMAPSKMTPKQSAVFCKIMWRHDRCLLLKQDRCLLLWQDNCSVDR